MNFRFAVFGLHIDFRKAPQVPRGERPPNENRCIYGQNFDAWWQSRLFSPRSYPNVSTTKHTLKTYQPY